MNREIHVRICGGLGVRFPGATRRDGNRRLPYDGPASFDFLGFTFRARSMSGRRGRFTGYGPAASGKALAKMSEVARSWRLHRRVDLTWKELVHWIGPVISGWINYYG